MKKLLFVAFHFPPYGGGSGVHRASKFARYLMDNGWRPYVLSAKSSVYEQTSPASLAQIPAEVEVRRTFALDAQRHFAIRGRYPGWAAIPDRWTNWALGAIPAGLGIIRKQQIDVILVTFPIATTVLIGLVLHWLSGKPLIVDFRDSMTEDEYPRDPLIRKVYRWIEKSVIKRGSRFIFTARSARRMYLDRYPDLAADKCIVIPNGFDEDDFSAVAAASEAHPANARVRLVHAGLIYPDDRDPRAFFRAVHRLKQTGAISAQTLSIDLRASGSEDYYSQLLRELDIADIVRLLPQLPHREALSDTAGADGLLLFQAASCNHQIPAKVYEYLRFFKPIFALTSHEGDTADLLQQAGGSTIVELTDEEAILDMLPRFITAVRQGSHPLPETRIVERYTRKNGTNELANCLDEVIGRRVSGMALQS